MSQTQFSVSWESYQKNICKGLSCLQEKGEFVDMTLAADGHLVKVHRMVISLISPFMKALISSIDCPHPVIFLNNISYSTLCLILEYIYTGEVMVQKESINEFVQAGKALQIKGLDFMMPGNCFGEVANDAQETITGDINDIKEKNYNEFINPLKSAPKVKDFIERINIPDDYDEPMNQDTSDDNDETDEKEDKLTIEKKDKLNVEKVHKLSVEKERKLPIEKESSNPSKVNALQYTISNQGGLQMILNRYVYNVRYMSRNTTKRRWNCIYYPGKRRCKAFVVTEDEKVIKRGCSHNHPFDDMLIMKKFREGLTYSVLKDAETQVQAKKKGIADQTITSEIQSLNDKLK